MIAEIEDIRFACHQCGQHLVVEAAAAGSTADCPICEAVVRVPAASSRAKEAAGEVETATAKAEPPRAHYPEPASTELREELFNAALQNGQLERVSTEAREEIAKLQQQLRAVTDECERLNASATHTQAELKTFQTERQQLKADLSQLRQRVTSAETQLATRERELAEARAATLDGEAKTETVKALEAAVQEAVASAGEWQARVNSLEAILSEHRAELSTWEALATGAETSLQEEREQRERLAAELALAQEQLAGTQDSLRATETDLSHTRETVAELASSLANATARLDEIEQDRVEAHRQLEEASARLKEAGDWKARLARAEEDLGAVRDKLHSSEEGCKSLTVCCEELRREADALRRDLGESHNGREIIELRSKLSGTEAEAARTASRLALVEESLKATTESELKLRAEVSLVASQRDDAQARLAELSSARITKDNEVLRGIIARQNSELAQRHGEIFRLKRARYILKIVYTLFGVGLLGVVAFALKVLLHAF